MARNGVHSGGKKKARYYKVWDKETGVYKGIWRLSGGQICIFRKSTLPSIVNGFLLVV